MDKLCKVFSRTVVLIMFKVFGEELENVLNAVEIFSCPCMPGLPHITLFSSLSGVLNGTYSSPTHEIMPRPAGRWPTGEGRSAVMHAPATIPRM